MEIARKSYLTLWRLVAAAIVGLIVLALAPMVLYPFRNAKPESIAERFLRSRSEIATEVGDIKSVGKVETRSRSEETARRLRTGESLVDITNSSNAESRALERLPEDVSSLRLNVTGSRRNAEVEVTLKKEYFGENYVPYYIVIGTTYKNENGDHISLPVGWLENYFLLFR